MLKRLRWELTAFYFFAALAIIILVGGGSYFILHQSLDEVGDLGLQYRMALQFHLYGLKLPPELIRAEKSWVVNNDQSALAMLRPNLNGMKRTLIPPTMVSEQDQGNPVAVAKEQERQEEENDFEEGLSPSFVVPNPKPNQAANNVPAPTPIVQDTHAVAEALEHGVDLRNISLPDGRQVRLLTYRVSIPSGPSVLQVGRLLQGQERTLNRFLLSLLVLAALSTIILGIGSWLLSGRSIGPAQKAWDQQQVFISNASHELRTPLTLIRASADFALRSGTEEEKTSALRDILQDSDYMNRMVDDLLTLSRLDTQRLLLKREKVDLAALLSEATRQGKKMVEGKSIEILSQPVEGMVWGDGNRLRQVLLILLDNAARFTSPGGSITLEARLQEKTWEIWVIDTGCGIEPQHLRHVFERFYQAPGGDNEISRNNGLGLSIAKGLIEAQGGQIALMSQAGEGVQVALTLPRV